MPERATKSISALRARVRESLFPSPPPGGSGFGRVEAGVLVVAVLTLAVIAQLLRVGPSASLNSLWAEDGPIFLQSALYEGFWHAVFSPYAGYLVLVPRLIGEVAALVPLRDAAAATAICAGLVVALSGLVVWFASAGHIRNPYLRGTLVALTVLSPVAGLESVAAGSYVLWYMLFAAFWVLLWRPATARGAVLGGLFLLATGLSTPAVWFFAPVAVLRALAGRDRRDLAILAGYAAGAAIQIPVLALNSEAAVKPHWTSDIWTTYLQRVVDGGALGERLGGVAWADLGWPFLIVLVVGVLAGLAFGAWRSSPTARVFAAVAIPSSLAMFVASVYQRAVGTQMKWPEGMHFGNGGRYVIVPALLLVSTALVAIDRWPRPLRGPSRLPWVAAAATAVLMAGLVTSFDLREPAARGTPAWSNALRDAAAACVAEDLPDASVPISPPGFGLVISCERLSSLYEAGPAR
jgi:hypothetical protein